MALRFGIITLTCLIAAGLILNSAVGAPLSPTKNEQDLVRSFAKFLEQDKGLSQALHRIDFDSFDHSRYRRQAIEEADVDDVQDIDPNKKEAGFFDRAAKFVMEVLQRFLKWVNQDN